MLTIVFDRSQIYFIPSCFQTRLSYCRIPIQQFAVFTCRYHNRFFVFDLCVHFNIFELNCHLFVRSKTYVCNFTCDNTCHLVHYIFCHSSTTIHYECFVDSCSHRILKRDLFCHCCSICFVVCYKKFHFVTKRCTKCCQIYKEHVLAFECILYTLCQHIINHPCLIQCWRSWFLFYAQFQRFICCEFKEHIILFQYIEEYSTKLFYLFTTCCNCPIITPHCTCRTVKTKIESHFCLIQSVICYYKVQLFVICHLCQIKTIPCFACLHFYSCPIKIFRFCTSIIHDVACLIFLSRKSDCLCRM